jgi:hypothetical protein
MRISSACSAMQDELHTRTLKTFWLLVLGFCLISFSSNVLCSENWVKYKASSVSDLYIDIDSIQLTGNVTSYRSVINFRHPATTTASVVTLNEMKCSTKEARFLKMITSSEYFGRGRMIGAITPAMMGLDGAQFFPIQEGLVDQYDLVCARK